MMLPFHKMHGLGNDFMLIDATEQSVALSTEQICRWADRRTGVGFDQLLLIKRLPAENTFSYQIFNSDGSEVGQCGNGARCVAYYLFSTQKVSGCVCYLQTHHETMKAVLESSGHITVNMGKPNFIPAHIPLLLSETTIILQEPADYLITLPLQRIEAHVLSLGNPHCVIQVEDITQAPVLSLGNELAQHPAFPESVNVGFMQVLNPQRIDLRVLERGAGETQACGSGACAAVVAGTLAGLLSGRNVEVRLPGGSLWISWESPQGSVFMTGEAIAVFQGEITL